MTRLPALLRRASRRAAADGDDGFTTLEVVMAIALVTIVMTAFASFFVGSAGATDSQGQRQTAVQLTTDAMDRARSLTGVGLLNLRDKTSSDAQWVKGKDSTTTTSFPGVAPYLTTVTEAYDTTSGLAANAGYSASLPTNGRTVTVDNITFTQNWFLGYCYSGQTVTSGACTATSATGTTKYLQVVVAVTWANRACRNNLCSYVSATLISPTPDPLFDANQSAPKPRITNPGNQVNDVSQSVSLAIVLTGGTAPITWTATGLPPGLTLYPGTATVISGTPTTAGVYAVVVKVVDGFGFVSTAAFTWTINTKPVLTNPGNQTDTKGDTVNLPLVSAGGSPSVSYSATGLPTGLSINSSTGVISGSPTLVGTSSVTARVTDSIGVSSTATFTWTVYAAPTINTATSFTTSEGAAPSSATTYSCFNGPCTIALAGSVPGIGLKTTLDSNADNTTATSLTVATGSGTVYLNGTVSATAVTGTSYTSTASYTPTLTITDADAATATDSGSWTVRVNPVVSYPGHLSVARNGTVAQSMSYTCSGSCTITVSGAPSGVGLATSPSSSANSYTSGTASGSTSFSGTFYLTGKVSSTATTGTTTVTMTVTDTIGGTSYSITSVGVWTVS